ncbi:MAG: peptidase U32 family protein [bacterium]
MHNIPQRLTTTPELLAPAGSAAALQAALAAGCDAVYFGVDCFNMRVAAENFRRPDMARVVARCHARGVAAYLTLNTIVYEPELPAVEEVVRQAVDAQVDAVIAWDPAILLACQRAGLPCHLSTQASISNSATLLYYYRTFGIRRFVLARECSLEQIAAIHRTLQQELGAAAAALEIEVFAHGAMCVSISGRCFLSDYHYGRSGNRGDCLQPCRRKYRIVDVEGELEYELGEDYVLSPRDLCTIPFLDRLLQTGIASLKIEGRNRSPEYVDVVVRAYRRALDHLAAHGRTDAWPVLQAELLENLKSVYNRGFSAGYFFGRPTGDLCQEPDSRATQRKEFVGPVVNYYRQVSAAEINVQGQPFAVGDELLILGPTTGLLRVQVNAIQVEHQSVPAARQGTHVAVSVDRKVRLHDKVYVVRATPERDAGPAASVSCGE